MTADFCFLTFFGRPPKAILKITVDGAEDSDGPRLITGDASCPLPVYFHAKGLTE